MTFRTLSKEEQANTVSHGIGAILSIVGLIYFLYLGICHGTFSQIFSMAVFGLTLVLLYSFSTLYHATPDDSDKKLYFQKLDHSAIYFLIAGSYTAFMMLGLPGKEGNTILVINWILALIGVVTEVFDLLKRRVLPVLLYLAMGWLVIFFIKSLFLNLPGNAFILLLAGGVFYTLGVYFYAHQRKTFFHAIWHIFVLLGSLCHYISVLLIFLHNAGGGMG